MLTHKKAEEQLLAFPGAWLDYPFGEGVAVYKVGNKEDGTAKMFAIIAENSSPLKLSLKCDPILAVTLRKKYETIVPGHHLNKKHWNTIICSGQLNDDEIADLIRHSYELVRP